MSPTPFPHIDEMLATLLSATRRILGDRLVGLYLYGSLVTGDFDNETSDIDLLAVMVSDIDRQEFDVLLAMHDDFARSHPRWAGRIEVQYLSVAALRTFKTRPSKLAVISPGEPFHVVEGGSEWTPNWYVVQEKGRTLFGPSPRTLIDPISREEFTHAVREHARHWREWVHHIAGSRPSQAYAILTLCRALYTHTHGEQISKKRAAAWAQQQLPQWSPLIADALRWRQTFREEQGDPAATFPETLRFTHFVVDRIAGA